MPINFDELPGERPISYEEALQVIQNNWPDSGFSQLRTALNELQRLAAIGYAEETRPVYPAGYGPDMRPLTKEKALELLTATLRDSKADRMLQMFLDAHATFEAKNGDYGDAFSYTLKKHGDVAALTRVTDKFLRIETLLTGRNAAVKDETVEDTIKDLGNYCFMWLMERQLMKEEHYDAMQSYHPEG